MIEAGKWNPGGSREQNGVFQPNGSFGNDDDRYDQGSGGAESVGIGDRDRASRGSDVGQTRVPDKFPLESMLSQAGLLPSENVKARPCGSGVACYRSAKVNGGIGGKRDGILQPLGWTDYGDD